MPFHPGCLNTVSGPQAASGTPGGTVPLWPCPPCLQLQRPGALLFPILHRERGRGRERYLPVCQPMERAAFPVEPLPASFQDF